MEKFRGLRLFGLVTILTFTLVLIGFNFVQEQVKTQDKPDKPPGKDKGDEVEYAWSAVILDGPFSISGVGNKTYPEEDPKIGWVYNTPHADINITVGVKVVHPRDPSQVRSYFTLEIFYPVQGTPEYQIDFITDNITDKVAEFDEEPWSDDWPPVNQSLNPDLTYKYLGFPLWYSAVEDTTGRDALEIFDFLQECYHPYGRGVEQDYYKVRLHFSNEWAEDLIGGTYDSWPIGDIEVNRKTMGYGGESGNFTIEGQNMARRHCDHGDYNVWNHHNIRGDGYMTIGEDGKEIWHSGWPGYIVRIDEDIWKVVVDGKKTNIYEEYCECVTERANKNRPLRTWLTVLRPISGSCKMNFEMLFIRTKQ